MKNKPSYYSIITAEVRYDNRLTDSEKLLYSEITSLTQSNGECWASNAYFSKLYSVTPQAISKRINRLKKYGYIEIKYIYGDKGKNINARIIKLTDLGVSTTVDRVSTTVEGGINQRLRGYQPEVKDNNTSINNTSINNIVPFKEIIDYLNKKSSKRFRVTAAHKKSIQARWNENYTLDDFKKVVDNKVAEWKDTDMDQYLRPSTLFGTKFDNYLNQSPKTKIKEIAPMPVYDDVEKVDIDPDEARRIRERLKKLGER